MALNKTPEGILVSHPKWQGSYINNDAHILKAKGITGLDPQNAYAKAFHRQRKVEIWFRTPERLKAWKNTAVDSNEFTIKIFQV